jgi:GSH-dependent disulfide-bond oxidoreductase
MITLYTWVTSNGHKASIMLEEIDAAYEVSPVNLRQNEQHNPSFQKISPNNKIPVIIDHDGPEAPRTVFETGAILIYLAEKSGRLLPASGRRRDEALEWLFWASTGLAPMLGQWNHFARRAEEKLPGQIERFTKEAVRLFKVLDRRLGECAYLGQDYSIADIAAFTRTRSVLPALRETAGAALGDTPAIDRWLAEVGQRPAVKRGLAIPQV